MKLPREVAHTLRARAITAMLCDWLGATTSYGTKTACPTEKPPKWRDFYGWKLGIVPDKGAVLDADGKPSKVRLAKIFSHNPGDIITDKRGKKYAVQPDHSLRVCA